MINHVGYLRHRRPGMAGSSEYLSEETKAILDTYAKKDEQGIREESYDQIIKRVLKAKESKKR